MKRIFFTTVILALLLMCGGGARAQESKGFFPKRQWNVFMGNYGMYSQSEIYAGLDTMVNGIPSSQIYENEIYVGSYYEEEDKCFLQTH